MSASNDTRTHAATSTGEDKPVARAVGLLRGDTVGRYLIVDRLGAGAMGVVYSAYDPELDRKIAVKVLLPSPSPGASVDGGSADAQRLRREAQALAKLSHPSVVAVYDVGAIDGQVFIAMEYVEGVTLGAWATAERRSAREIVEVMIEAGRGLAAAHNAGLLHRDFKPDNVMIETTTGARTHGRVRVMDFGLARSKASKPRTASDDATPIDATREGAIVGTPAYMAPEQLAGLEIDARADQFAFAVTLWELLFGARPFKGASLAELAANVFDRQFAPAPRHAAVPSWLRKIAIRGLAADVGERFATMDAMLVALGRDPTRWRRRVAGVAAASALVLGGVAWQRIAHARRLAACDETAIDGVWNDERRAEVSAAMASSGASQAAITWEKLGPRLDAHARDWRALARDVCRLDVNDGPSDSRARAHACLDDRRLAFTAFVDELALGKSGSVPMAVTTASRLPRVAACADEQWLAQRTPPPSDPEIAARVAELEARMFESIVRQELGEYDRARAAASEALDGARALGWVPALAKAEMRMGMSDGLLGDRRSKVERLRSAYFAAGAAGADDIAFEAASALAFAEGYELGNGPVGLEWGRHAEMILDRTHEPEDSLRRATLATMLGVVHDNLRDFDGALALHQRALEIREQTLGADHLDVATTLGNIGLAHFGRGEYALAVDFLGRSLAAQERIYGPDHPSTKATLNNLGMAEMATGANDAALGHFEQAVGLIERDLGASHPDLASGLNNLGVLLRIAGKPEAARAKFERAAAIWRDAKGGDPADLALALDNLGIVARMVGDYDDALARHDAALALRERLLGADHHDVANSLEGIGRVAIERGRFADAIAPLERALAILEKEPNPVEVGNVRFVLARALADLDRGRARALATRAADEMRGGSAEDLAEVVAWLAAHPAE